MYDYGSESNTPNIMTITRAIYKYAAPESKKPSRNARPILLGVIAFDMNLSKLKDILDAISENLGRTSFPLLVTPQGDTIYHELMTQFKKRTLFNIGKDISNYEYFTDLNDATRSFANTVRAPFLRGELGDQSLRVLRALPAGDAATEGFEGKEIDTTYFYNRISGWDLRLALSYDQFDLQQTILLPSCGPRTITSQLKDYLTNPKNVALANQVPNLKFFNNNNCKAQGSDVIFSNCKPDAYCARALAGTTHPLGTVPDHPACVTDSTCECEMHRWPIGLTATNTAALHVAPKSLIVPQNAYDLNSGDTIFDAEELTYEMTKFLNRDDKAENPPLKKLRASSIEQILSATPIIDYWVEDQKKGVHTDTVWLYYATCTGMSIIFPPNNWGFLWDPTRRPWYGRAISVGERVRAAISTPYVDGGGAGLMNTLSSVVYGKYGPKKVERKINGVMGYDFLYPVMNNMLPALTDCSAKSVRDISQTIEWTLLFTAQAITEDQGVTVTQGTNTGLLKTTLSNEWTLGITPQAISENVGVTVSQNEWTLAITAQGINESAGVTVKQGSLTGTLKTALSNEWTLAVLNAPVIAETAGVTVSQDGVAKGTLISTISGGATSITIETVSDVTILDSADVTIGSTVLVHANINTATNNGATTQIIVQAAAGISFVTTADLVIGSTTVALANVNTATNSVLATGTLKTALSGGTTSSVVIETAAGVTFVTTANVMIGSTPLLLANINTATNTPTTSLIVETAASVTLITTSDIVIGSTTVLYTNLNTVTKTKSREIGCWLFEFSGLFLSHSDFLISEKEKANIEGTGTDDTASGAWPIENVFVGKKEPDLADALIKANILKEHKSRTPDSSEIVYFYRVNEDILKEAELGVMSGTLNSANSKCLQAPSDSNPVKWFVSHVADSNAFILVVDGYRRKDTECVSKTQSKPVKTRSDNDIIDKCGKQAQFLFEASSWQTKSSQCPLCDPGEYGAVAFESCRLCPPGQYSEFAGSATCSNCTEGDYNEVAGQSVCRSCPKGTYSLEIGADKNPCIDCPPGAVCSGGSNMETNVLMSVPQLTSQDGKNVFKSYWRDPLILNTTGKASSCFYECVEPRSCLGTLSCNDDDKGTGELCKEWRKLLLSFSPFINGTKNEEGTFIFNTKELSTQNWNDELKTFMNYTELIYGNIACKETSSIGEAYCIVTRLKEGCAKGYHGETCSGCLPGYSRSGPTMTQCAKCSSQSNAVTIVVLLVIFALALYAFLIISTLSGYGNLPREGIIMRVISSNILIVSLFKDLEVQWPSSVKLLMGAGSVAGDPVSLLNIECLAQAEGIPYIIMKAIIALSMPIIFFILLGIIFGTQYLLSKRHFQESTIKNDKNGERRTDIFATSLTAAMANRFNKKLTKNKKNGDDEDNEVYAGEDHGGLMSMKNVVDPTTMFKGSLVVMIYMLYPSLVKNTFGGIECVQHKQMGNTDQCPDLLRTEKQYFFRDQSVQCYNDEHYLYLYAIFLPALLFYVIMVPVFFFFQLKKHKRFIFAGPTLHRVTWGKYLSFCLLFLRPYFSLSITDN